MKRKNKNILRIIQLFITLILFFIIFRNIDIGLIIQKLAIIQPIYLLVSMLNLIFFQIFFVLRWKLLLNYNKIYFSFIKLIKYDMIARFFQNFLPSAVSGDIIRALLSFRNKNKVAVSTSVLFARSIGLIILGCLSFIDFILLSKKFSFCKYLIKYKIFFPWIALFLILIFFGIVISLYQLSKKEKVKFFFKSFFIYIKDKNFFLKIFLLSVIIQFFSLLRFYFAFRIISLNINIYSLFLYLPLIAFAALLPISFNGQGIKEILILFFYKDFVKREDVLLIFLIFLLYNLLSAIPGAIFFLFFRRDNETLSIKKND